MAERYFVFVMVDDASIRRYLDTAIYIADPSTKWPAHITVAGPYSRWRETPQDLTFASQIYIDGVGNFFQNQQNTVYLRVRSHDLKHVWDKPDYGFNPHLTIYDGADHSFAWKLYNRLAERDLRFSFSTQRLSIATSFKYKKASELKVDTSLLYFSALINKNQIFTLSSDMRADLVAKLLAEAASKVSPFAAPPPMDIPRG